MNEYGRWTCDRREGNESVRRLQTFQQLCRSSRRQSQLKIHLRPIDYQDPRASSTKCLRATTGRWIAGSISKSAEDLDYVVGIIEQSYKSVL